MQRDVFSRVRPDQLNWIVRRNPDSLKIVLDSGINVSAMDAWQIEQLVAMVNRIVALEEICDGPADDDTKGNFYQRKLDEAIQTWQDTISRNS